jgi:hypothetical protein
MAWPEFRNTIPAQRFHMDKNVGGAFPAGEETEPPQPIEPLDLRPLQAAGGGHRDMRPGRRHMRRMDCRRFVDRQDAKGLKTLWALQHFADDARAFICGLKTVPAQASHVQEHVRHAVVRYDKAESLRDVEPLDDAGNLDDVDRAFTDKVND